MNIDERINEIVTLKEPLAPAIKALIREVVAEITLEAKPNDPKFSHELIASRLGFNTAIAQMKAKAKELLK